MAKINTDKNMTVLMTQAKFFKMDKLLPIVFNPV